MVVIAAYATVLMVLLAAAGVLVSLHLRRRRRRGRARAVLTTDGFQEASVIVSGRYWPDVVEVQQDIPVRLRFGRQEDDPCSERVVFAGMGVDRKLPAFRETAIEFVPREPGEFIFTCNLGMYQGTLVVLRSSSAVGNVPSRANAGIRSESRIGGGG